MSVKQTAAIYLVSFGLVLLSTVPCLYRERVLIKSIAVFIAVILLTHAFWYVRNFIMTGDLFYPYFTKSFASGGVFEEQNYAEWGSGASLLSWLLLPINLTFKPDLFDRFHWIGPAYLLFSPLALYALIKRKGESVYFAAIISVSATVWFVLAQNVRFLLPTLPFIVILTCIGYSCLPQVIGNRSKKLIGCLAIMLVLGYAMLSFYHFRVQLNAYLQGWTAKEYLFKLERSYPIAYWANNHLPSNAILFNATEVREYYFNRPLINASMFSRMHHQESAQEWLTEFENLGITHILLAKARDPELSRKLNQSFEQLNGITSDRKATKALIRMNSENIREHQYTYEVFQILSYQLDNKINQHS